MCLVPDKEQAAHASKCRIRGIAVLAGEDIIKGFATSISHYPAVEADKGHSFYAGICKGAKMEEKMSILKGAFYSQTCSPVFEG
jgi:hypothetical protein